MDDARPARSIELDEPGTLVGPQAPSASSDPAMMSDPPVQFDRKRLLVRYPEERERDDLLRLFEAGCLEGHVPEHDTGDDIINFLDYYFGDENMSAFWVAKLDELTLGMIAVKRHRDGVAEIRRLRVHPDYRRLGIGTVLMSQAVEFCRSREYLKVILDTRVEREPAIRLFEKFGFMLSKQREHDGRKLLDFYFDLYRDPE